MPPPKSARLRAGMESHAVYKTLGEQDFDKRIQLFGVYGVEHGEIRLLNGDVVVKGDCVEIKQGYDHSNTSYDGERWFAEVIEIKGEDEHAGNAELYLLCNWFYSEANVLSLNSGVTVGNITRCPFSKRELMLSNHQQVFAPENIICKVHIRFFDELSRKQPQIGNHEYWYRFNLRIGKGPMDTRVAQGKNRHLPPARCAIETCQLGRYKPDEHIQIFCPRKGCKFWYHEQCLATAGFIVTSEKLLSDRLRSMLHGTKEFKNWTDEYGEEHDDVPDEWYATLNGGITEEWGGDEPIFPDYEEGSIINMIWCAQTSIRRGFKKGIVGNADIVKEAREQLRDIINCWSSDYRWPRDEVVAKFQGFGKPKDIMYHCIRCNSVI